MSSVCKAYDVSILVLVPSQFGTVERTHWAGSELYLRQMTSWLMAMMEHERFVIVHDELFKNIYKYLLVS